MTLVLPANRSPAHVSLDEDRLTLWRTVIDWRVLSKSRVPFTHEVEEEPENTLLIIETEIDYYEVPAYMALDCSYCHPGKRAVATLLGIDLARYDTREVFYFAYEMKHNQTNFPDNPILDASHAGFALVQQTTVVCERPSCGGTFDFRVYSPRRSFCDECLAAYRGV